MSEAETPSFEMTWSSTTSSGYCSQEDSDSELEQYFTARTSLVRRPRRDQVGSRVGAVAGGRGAVAPILSVPAKLRPGELVDRQPPGGSTRKPAGMCIGLSLLRVERSSIPARRY